MVELLCQAPFVFFIKYTVDPMSSDCEIKLIITSNAMKIILEAHKPNHN